MIKVRLMKRIDASAYLLNEWGIGRSAKTLAKYATTGDGPPFRKDGKNALYASADLDVFARSILSPLVKSTAELAALKTREDSVDEVLHFTEEIAVCSDDAKADS